MPRGYWRTSLSIRRRALLGRVLGLSPALAVITLFMVVPIGIIAVYSFLEADPYGGVEMAFSLEAYRQFLFQRDLFDELVFDTTYLSIFARSFVLAAASAFLCFLLGFPTAYFISTRPAQQRNLLILLVTVPFWTNLLIRTYSWILILRDYGLINNALLWLGVIQEPLPLLYTNGAILLGLVYSYLPFMVLPIYATVERLDRTLVEAAHDLYANRWRVMRRVILPLAMPGIVAGSLLVFIPSLGAFVAPDLLGGGRNLMIGSLVQMQFSSSRNWPFGAAAALILLAVVLVALILYARNAKDLEGG
jgi:spermidine/putrescine transport system permease protein